MYRCIALTLTMGVVALAAVGTVNTKPARAGHQSTLVSVASGHSAAEVDRSGYIIASS